MPDEHARLSASGASRWLACPPSAVLESNFPNTSSVFAEEGTLAHTLGELTLRKELKLINTKKFNAELKKIKENELYSPEMIDYVQFYVDTCMEKVSEARAKTPDALVAIEQRLDFSQWVKEGFGTGDFVIIADGTMEVCDLKYGKGLAVSAEENPQMKLYALGAISQYAFLYDIQKVRMTIIQPRLDSISTYEMSTEDLLKWADEIVKPTAELAYGGNGEFSSGEHCRFCRANASCRKRAEENMELAKMEFRKKDLLSSDEIAEVLGKVDELVKWSKDVKEYALEQALQGVVFPGYKIVEGKSNRAYTDQESVLNKLIEEGYTQEQILTTPELKGITAMEKVLGKKDFTEVLNGLVDKPRGKPTLVILGDKRAEWDTPTSDFKEVKECELT